MSTYHRSGYGEFASTFALVTINGQEFAKKNAISVNIHQSMLAHTTFELTCPSETFNDKANYPLKNAIKLLGGDVTIQFRKQGENLGMFTGYITHVDYQKNNKYPFIIIKGQSYSGLLDSQKTCRTYHNKTLSDILKEVFNEYTGSKIDFLCQPNMKAVIPYVVSYNETAFEFMRRLAIRYGEYFFWNSSQLIFGGTNQRRTELKEGRDYLEYNLSVGVASQHLAYDNYHPDAAEIFHADSADAGMLTNPFQEKAVDKAHKVFLKSSDAVYFDALSETQSAAQEQKMTCHQKALENLVTLNATTTHPKLRLGDIAGMLAYIPEFSRHKNSGTPIESYIITQITHTYTSQGYSNRFTAIPREQEIAPYWDMNAYPRAEDQSAIVVDNNDPLAQNRIKVQFPWQKKTNQTSPWIRLVQGHGGEDQGFHVIPEISHEVFISFRGNNAEVPIVTGSLYNGKQKSGFHTAKNNYKVLKTRSGHTIKLDDTEGKEKIQVFDKNGNQIEIDTVGNTINIFANATINLNATDINLIAKRAITATAGVSFTASSGATSSITGGISTFINAGKETAIKAGKTLSAKGGKSTLIASGMNSQMIMDNKGNTSIKSKKKVDVFSKERVNIAGDKQTAVVSKDMKIQGKQKTSIKGNQVRVG